jgi:enolase
MFVIEQVKAREILDSRGRPTVLVTCKLRDGSTGSASVPSGASTGLAEALELRDGDPRRYRGLGCRKAVENVNSEINAALLNRPLGSQSELDQMLLDLDGTANKSRLGANAILAVSLAFARAASVQLAVPLWQYFAKVISVTACSLPRLTINLFSGGKHAGGQVAIQDVLLVPALAETIDDSLRMTYDVYQAAAELAFSRFGMRLLRADEGGLAPPFRTAEEMIQAAIESIETAGYNVGTDFFLAIDVAASQFHSEGKYSLDGEVLDALSMIDRLARWVERYPIISVEDGLAENDWAHWPILKQAIGRHALVLGDDLLCTDPERIRRAIQHKAANALLLKVNQVGTLTEAGEAYRLARSAGWSVVTSVRSGETEDTWAADLAVGWGADQFKNGSITQSERLAKYNRLLEIEAITRWPVRQCAGIVKNFAPSA